MFGRSHSGSCLFKERKDIMKQAREEYSKKELPFLLSKSSEALQRVVDECLEASKCSPLSYIKEEKVQAAQKAMADNCTSCLLRHIETMEMGAQEKESCTKNAKRSINSANVRLKQQFKFRLGAECCKQKRIKLLLRCHWVTSKLNMHRAAIRVHCAWRIDQGEKVL
jgi:hypothetical protein